METFSIAATAKSYPRFKYEVMKNDIVGNRYVVSLVFVGKTRAQKLNVAYRKKTYIPNVLAFPIEKNHGEIYICPQIAKKEAKNHGLTENGYIAYLFIHALLHLKGHDHGDTMDKAEKRFLTKYGIR